MARLAARVRQGISLHGSGSQNGPTAFVVASRLGLAVCFVSGTGRVVSVMHNALKTPQRASRLRRAVVLVSLARTAWNKTAVAARTDCPIAGP